MAMTARRPALASEAKTTCSCPCRAMSSVTVRPRTDGMGDSGVPDAQDALLPLASQEAERRGVEAEQRTAGRGEPDPPGAERTQEVPVREQHRHASGRLRARQHAVGPFGHLLGGLTTERAVREDRPLRDDLADVGRRAPLVLAVVPLGEFVGHLGPVAQAGELARLPRAPSRAGEHQRHVDAGQARRQRARLLATTVRQLHVGERRVPARAAPFRLAVADEDHRDVGSEMHESIFLLRQSQVTWPHSDIPGELGSAGLRGRPPCVADPSNLNRVMPAEGTMGPPDPRADPREARAVLVFAGGDAPGPGGLARTAGADLVIAADSGLAHARALGVHVDLVIGDLDSVDPTDLDAAVADGAVVERHPAAKDATDLELALDPALDR